MPPMEDLLQHITSYDTRAELSDPVGGDSLGVDLRVVRIVPKYAFIKIVVFATDHVPAPRVPVLRHFADLNQSIYAAIVIVEPLQRHSPIKQGFVRRDLKEPDFIAIEEPYQVIVPIA